MSDIIIIKCCIAVNMIDNFDCEETVIGQFVRLQLDHCLIDTKA